MLRRHVALLVAGLTLFCVAETLLAHGPVERVPAVWKQQARLFVADAATGEVLVVDLPEGNSVTRIPTPPFIMVMGFSKDEQYLFAMRGRSTDRDWVTVIHTGFDTATGAARFPRVVRTFLGSAPGGVHHGYLPTVGGKNAVFMEGTGEIHVFENDHFNGLHGVEVRRYKLPAPDHTFYLEAGENLYVGLLAKGYVQVLSRESGKQVARISGCPVLHGMARDELTHRLFYACQGNVMVVGTQGNEADREVARIAYPQPQRVAAFLKGKARVWWGYTEGELPALYRLDAARQPYVFETLSVDASVRQNVNDDGSLLLVLTRAGVLQVRDGGSGELIRIVTVSAPFDKEFHEHVDKAILPDIQTLGNLAYVSLPHEGRIAEIDLQQGTVIRYLEVGGEPTRLRLLKADGTPGAD